MFKFVGLDAWILRGVTQKKSGENCEWEMVKYCAMRKKMGAKVFYIMEG